MTIDCSGINKDDPRKFRTEADKPDFQNCYFNLTNGEQAYNEFVSKRINDREWNDRIQFKIIELVSEMNIEENFAFTGELCNLTNNMTQQQVEMKKKELEHLWRRHKIH